MSARPPDGGASLPSPWLAVARWAFVALGLAALANMLRQAELGRAVRLVGDIGAPIVLVLLPWGVALTLQALGIARILGALGRTVSFPRLLSVVVSGEAVLMSFPGGAALAEGLSPYLLQRRCGVPLPEGLAAVAAKKALIILANGLYMGLAAVVGVTCLGAASRALIGVPGLQWLVAGVAAAVLTGALVTARVLFSGTLAARSRGLLGRIPSARLRRWLEGAEGGFAETDRHFAALFAARTRALVLAVGAFLGCWLVEASEAWLILRLLGAPVPYAEVLAFEVVVSLLRSMAFMIPGGLGVQDAGYVAFFAAFGIPDAATLGVAFVLIKRARELCWISAGFSLFAALGDRLRAGVGGLPRPDPITAGRSRR